jgi:hypothetical protein
MAAFQGREPSYNGGGFEYYRIRRSKIIEYSTNRVVAVEFAPGATQGELLAALEPVVDRLTRLYKAAQAALQVARAKPDEAAAKAAQEELNALILFKGDMGAFIRLYTFLCQIFDYGNTAIEKRSIFYKHLPRARRFCGLFATQYRTVDGVRRSWTCRLNIIG